MEGISSKECFPKIQFGCVNGSPNLSNLTSLKYIKKTRTVVQSHHTWRHRECKVISTKMSKLATRNRANSSGATMVYPPGGSAIRHFRIRRNWKSREDGVPFSVDCILSLWPRTSHSILSFERFLRILNKFEDSISLANLQIRTRISGSQRARSITSCDNGRILGFIQNEVI